MNKYFLKLLPLLGILIITVFSCKNDEDITIPDTGIVTPPDLEPNVDLTFVKNLDDGTIIDFNTVQNNRRCFKRYLSHSCDREKYYP